MSKIKGRFSGDGDFKELKGVIASLALRAGS